MTFDRTAVAEIAEIVREGTEPTELEIGRVYAFRLGDRVHEIDLTGDQYHTAPKRKTGATVVRDVPSWLTYWTKHSDSGSEIYASRDALAVTAVLDAHTADAPRFGEHRLKLALKHSDEFAAWHAASGRMMNQEAFAEFLEDHRAAVTEPTAADMVELAQTFQATTRVEFKSSTILASGQRALSYVETVDASAGAKGKLVIPPAFTLALQVFEGATEADQVTARLRYRINGGNLQLGFVLDQIGDVISAAFTGIAEAIGSGTGRPVLYGTPA